MQKIIPNLWFDSEGQEATKFYTSIFKNSKMLDTTYYLAETPSNKPRGSILTVSFEIAGLRFIALNGGPFFKLNPSISFFVNLSDEKELDQLWEKLSEGGKALMPLDKYPFAKKYGWIQDKFGLSWQLILSDKEKKITPLLMFVGKVAGKAEEAMKFYTSLFEDSKIITAVHYEKGEQDRQENIKHAEFTLAGQDFMAMDSSLPHEFTFNEALSLMVPCETQEEIDSFWEKMSAVPEAEQCGWLKDKYGVSWQIVPTGMEEMLNNPDSGKAEKAMKAFLQMKKIDIAELRKASEG